MADLMKVTHHESTSAVTYRSVQPNLSRSYYGHAGDFDRSVGRHALDTD